MVNGRSTNRDPGHGIVTKLLQHFTGNHIRVAVTTELAGAIMARWDQADRDNLGPAVDYFHDLLQRYPEDR
jgi:hypothetical protein